MASEEDAPVEEATAAAVVDDEPDDEEEEYNDAPTFADMAAPQADEKDNEDDEKLPETSPGDRKNWDVSVHDAGQAESLEDSNMAGHGGKEHRDMRKAAAQGEKAWRGAGDELGVSVWRIEKFKVKHWPKDRYGEFYSGDSYIVLNTYKERPDGPKKYNAHFWLGAETTQDEAGTAAYKTVELDDLLGDMPVQYREVQGNESKYFLDLFGRMTILEGGIDSGFNHVKPTEYQPRLLHVRSYGKGRKRKVQVTQKSLEPDSLNDDDTFILDAGLEVYQWNGSTANVWEKRKGMMVLEEVVTSRNGKVKTKQVIDDLEPCDGFWKFFGGRPDKIAKAANSPAKGKSDNPEHERIIHRCCDETGQVEFTEVGRGAIHLGMLDSKDTFIVDVGLSVYVWIGKGCTKQEKREAMKYAVLHLQKSGRGASVPICRVLEGKEPAHFLEQFKLNRATLRSNPFAGGKDGAKFWK